MFARWRLVGVVVTIQPEEGRFMQTNEDLRKQVGAVAAEELDVVVGSKPPASFAAHGVQFDRIEPGKVFRRTANI